MSKVKETFHQRIIKKFGNNKLLVYFYLFFWTTIFFASLITSGEFLYRTFNNTFYYKEQLYNRLNKLNTRVSLTYFKQQLGEPLSSKNDRKYKQYLFVNKFFYVTADVDQNDEVISFSITSRHKDFKPNIKFRNSVYDQEIVNLTLNKTTFKDFTPNIGEKDCGLFKAPRTWIYSEGKYLGGEGEYKSFYVGLNNAGFMPTIHHSPDNYGENCNNVQDIFRTQTTINTFMVTDKVEDMRIGTESSIPVVGVYPQDISTVKE